MTTEDDSGDRADGSRIGFILIEGYRLTRLIGQGTMGTVYEAIQLRLGKRVAIKLMSRELITAGTEALARFRREAEVTSQLGHPHIVNLIDIATGPSGEPCLVMEYLDGEDLDHRIRRAGRLSLPVTARITRQVASALAATHARGIVHRDLKPANIFLLDLEGEADFVKVVDFGISKVKARASAQRLTNPSIVLGTPSYMAPEQATGRQEIDHRADQWSLACVVYEMLAGRGPFSGEDVAALLYQVVHQEPASLGERVDGIPPEVDRVLARALAKQPGDRFPTITAFARAFEAATMATTRAGARAETDGGRADSATPRWAKNPLWAAGAAALGTAVIMTFVGPRARRPVDDAAALPPIAARATEATGHSNTSARAIVATGTPATVVPLAPVITPIPVIRPLPPSPEPTTPMIPPALPPVPAPPQRARVRDTDLEKLMQRFGKSDRSAAARAEPGERPATAAPRSDPTP